MIVTIDGPAGTGKSTVARAVATAMGFGFLDTGAMYRAVAYEAMRRGANLNDQRELAFIGKHCRIDFDWSTQPPAVRLNGEPVGQSIRSAEATQAASFVAVVPAIRQQLVEQQQQIGRSQANLVTEGRDQGTVVFPDAPAKFYLDATPQERARRRAAQMRARGERVDQADLLKEIISRDQRDSGRAVGPLKVPDGAIVIDTTTLVEEQVVERIVQEVRARRTA